MFPRNLLKKTADFFKSIKVKEIDFKNLFITNFRDIIIIVIALWLIILAVVLLIARNSGKVEKENKNIIAKEKSEIEREKTQKENILNELLLNTDDFILPDRTNLDMTNDIADILPKKKPELTDKSFIKKEYKKMVDSDTEESLKFNFEKRKSKE